MALDSLVSVSGCLAQSNPISFFSALAAEEQHFQLCKQEAVIGPRTCSRIEQNHHCSELTTKLTLSGSVKQGSRRDREIATTTNNKRTR